MHNGRVLFTSSSTGGTTTAVHLFTAWAAACVWGLGCGCYQVRKKALRSTYAYCGSFCMLHAILCRFVLLFSQHNLYLV